MSESKMNVKSKESTPKKSSKDKFVPIQNGDDRANHNEWVAKAIYGFAINSVYDDLLTDEEAKELDGLKKWDRDVFYEKLLSTIKIPKNIEFDEDIRYYFTDFEFSDEDALKGETTLIVGIDINSIKAHYSGVMQIPTNNYELQKRIKNFVDANPRFSYIEPHMFVYVNMRK